MEAELSREIYSPAPSLAKHSGSIDPSSSAGLRKPGSLLHPEPSGGRRCAPRQEVLARQTRDEHGALQDSMRRLEAALATAATGRELAWNRRVVEKVRALTDLLAQHVASAVAPDGLLAEIEVDRPVLLQRVERICREHVDLLQQALSLQRRVEHYGARVAPNVRDIRQRCAWLLSAVRHHQPVELDLIYESLFAEIDSGD
jgi:hypothetical protein